MPLNLFCFLLSHEAAGTQLAEKILGNILPFPTSAENACSQSLLTEQVSKLYPNLW